MWHRKHTGCCCMCEQYCTVQLLHPRHELTWCTEAKAVQTKVLCNKCSMHSLSNLNVAIATYMVQRFDGGEAGEGGEVERRAAQYHGTYCRQPVPLPHVRCGPEWLLVGCQVGASSGAPESGGGFIDS